MKTYDEIKSELLEIAEVLKKYPDNIQPRVFEILTKHFLGHSTASQASTKETSPQHTKRSEGDNVDKPKSNGKGGNKSRESLTILKDLDLRPDGKQSFKDLYDEKMPNSASEFNTVAVYYLIDVIHMSAVTPNHVYTCYREATKRPPEAFTQSLRDTANKHGYIDTSDINNIKLPLRGRNFVEHDLPKQKSKK